MQFNLPNSLFRSFQDFLGFFFSSSLVLSKYVIQIFLSQFYSYCILIKDLSPTVSREICHNHNWNLYLCVYSYVYTRQCTYVPIISFIKIGMKKMAEGDKYLDYCNKILERR